MNLHRIHTILSLISGGVLVAVIVFTARTQAPVPSISVPQAAAVFAHDEPIIEMTTSTATTTDMSIATSTEPDFIQTTISIFKEIIDQASTTAMQEQADATLTATTTDDTSSEPESEGPHAALTW